MQLHNLEKQIDHQTIINNISVTINKGEITGIIGRNGSGKTTLFRLLSGQYILDSGKIVIEGQDINQHLSLKQKIFYIDEQEQFLNPYSLNKILLFYINAYPNFDRDKYFCLTKEKMLNENSKYRSLSKGMKGLYRIILAICSNADYLLLDEPFDGLDVFVRKNIIALILDTITDNSRAILISSHNLNELENIIDRALFLDQQQIQYDYHLENIREKARKVQLVFSSKKIPAVVKNNSKLLRYQGRVVTVVFEDYTDSLEQAIQDEQPLLFEELPLTLEDLFEINFSKTTKKTIPKEKEQFYV